MRSKGQSCPNNWQSDHVPKVKLIEDFCGFLKQTVCMQNFLQAKTIRQLEALIKFLLRNPAWYTKNLILPEDIVYRKQFKTNFLETSKLV